MRFSTVPLLATVVFPLACASSPLFSVRDILGALPPSADSDELRFQPLTDFDTDSCYFTSAIDLDGRTNPGLAGEFGHRPASHCRDEQRLVNHSNVYSRKRCNNGWCAIMYEYYFEKDATGSFGGHRHEWENIVVFTLDGELEFVAPSCHGYYDATSVAFNRDGDHAKFVYHKDGPGTHCWRIAADKDDHPVENYSGRWILGDLVGWNNWPNGTDGVDLRTRLFEAWHSEAVAPKLWDIDDTFGNTLRDASHNLATGFDFFYDE